MHLDLNLLTALDALLDERGVGAAADRLHLSQPAMSRTLSRIRRATGDPILVRSGRTMLPTPYAEQIRDEVHQLVTRAQTVLGASGRCGKTARRQTASADRLRCVRSVSCSGLGCDADRSNRVSAVQKSGSRSGTG
jgi:DNA-binding transcriptional LysR family regulator